MLREQEPLGRPDARPGWLSLDAPGPVWATGAVAAALVCLALLVVPIDSVAWEVLARGSAAVAVLISAVAVSLMDPPARSVWWGLVAYQALTWIGDLVYDGEAFLKGEASFPGWADPLYVAAYVCAFVALYQLIRRLQPDRQRGMLTGVAVLLLAATALMATFVLAPMLSGSAGTWWENGVAALYPVLDLAVLATLLRLLGEVRRWTLPMLLVVVSFSVLLVADIAFNTHALYVDDSTTAGLEMLFAIPMFTLTLAITAPRAALIADPGSVRRLHAHTPMLALSVGAVTVPLVMLYAAWQQDHPLLVLLAGIAVVVTVLVLSHVRYLLSTVETQSDQLRLQARTDALTGLPNRRTWEFELDRAERELADREDASLVVAMLDLDHFKEYNDAHGHKAGDEVLAHAAEAWRRSLPGEAFLARYGGEEFALILRRHSLEAAHEIVDRLRSVTPAGCTVSGGVAERRPGERLGDTLRRADVALYRAKAAGRDVVLVDAAPA